MCRFTFLALDKYLNFNADVVESGTEYLWNVYVVRMVVQCAWTIHYHTCARLSDIPHEERHTVKSMCSMDQNYFLNGNRTSVCWFVYVVSYNNNNSCHNWQKCLPRLRAKKKKCKFTTRARAVDDIRCCLLFRISDHVTQIPTAVDLAKPIHFLWFMRRFYRTVLYHSSGGTKIIYKSRKARQTQSIVCST